MGREDRICFAANNIGLVPPGYLVKALREASEEDLEAIERLIWRARLIGEIQQDEDPVRRAFRNARAEREGLE